METKVKKTEKKVVVKPVKKKIVKRELKLANYDATNMVLGRLSSAIAKKLMMGYKINVYNVEKCVVTGDAKVLVEEYTVKLNFRGKGNPEKGPKYPRSPERMFKKAVLRMLPHKKATGREAIKNFKAYLFNEDNVKLDVIKDAQLKQGVKYIELGALSTKLGFKW